MSATRETETVPRTALTCEEAAESIGVSLSHFRRHVLPTIKAVRIGRAVLVRPDDLDDWLQNHCTLNTPYN